MPPSALSDLWRPSDEEASNKGFALRRCPYKNKRAAVDYVGLDVVRDLVSERYDVAKNAEDFLKMDDIGLVNVYRPARRRIGLRDLGKDTPGVILGNPFSERRSFASKPRCVTQPSCQQRQPDEERPANRNKKEGKQSTQCAGLHLRSAGGRCSGETDQFLPTASPDTLRQS